MMQRTIVLTGLMLLAGCGTPAPKAPAPSSSPAPENTPLEGATLTPHDLSVLEAEALDYRIGAGDVLELYSSDNPEIGRKYVVGPDGQITLPGIGVMRADGMTRTELGKRVEDLLRPLYRAPSVSILVESYNNNRVAVLGEVRKPGQFNFADRPTIMSALARAEGLTDAADLRGCKIIRGRGTLIEINLYELLKRGNKALNIPLLPEDTVFVNRDEEHTFYVLGEVARPGVFSQGGSMDVVRALALAGDATEKGSLSGVMGIVGTNAFSTPAPWRTPRPWCWSRPPGSRREKRTGWLMSCRTLRRSFVPSPRPPSPCRSRRDRAGR